MSNSRRGAIPSDLGWLVDELASLSDRLDTLEAPSGENLSNTVAKLQASISRTVVPVAVHGIESPAAISSVYTDFAAVTTPVPDGYTRAVVSLTTSAMVLNSAVGGWALLNVSTRVNATSLASAWVSVDGGKYGTAVIAGATVLEGLTPGSSVVSAASAAFPATHSISRVTVDGTILFLR